MRLGIIRMVGMANLAPSKAQSRSLSPALIHEGSSCAYCRMILIALLIYWAAGPANAHNASASESAASGPLEWTFDPWITGPIFTLALLYAVGEMKLLRRSARRAVGPVWRSSVFFWAGVIVLVAALLSPVHELAEQLFTVHMIEHELVMAIAAPLLVLARPMGALLWGLPQVVRSRTKHVLSRQTLRRLWWIASVPAVATALHGLAIWVWHVPPLFDATVSDILLHRLQHLSFFLTGILFWWAVIWRSSRGRAAWHLFVTMMHTSILGALIALAPSVLYVSQTHHAADWGLTPLEDQQLAGILMWVPGGIVYAGAALWCLSTWIRHSSEGGEHDGRVAVR